MEGAQMKSQQFDQMLEIPLLEVFVAAETHSWIIFNFQIRKLTPILIHQIRIIVQSLK